MIYCIANVLARFLQWAKASLARYLVDSTGQDLHYDDATCVREVTFLMSQSGSSNDLFVHVSWKTRAGEPTLACDQLRQAALTAIRVQTRHYLCRILAMNCTPDRVDVVFRVPASLPVAQVARMSMKESDRAMTRFWQIFRAEPVPARNFWAREFTSRSLNAAEASEAEDYLRRQLTACHDA